MASKTSNLLKTDPISLLHKIGMAIVLAKSPMIPMMVWRTSSKTQEVMALLWMASMEASWHCWIVMISRKFWKEEESLFLKNYVWTFLDAKEKEECSISESEILISLKVLQ